jgi:transcriptional regulator with XRE-family HTH domain
MARAGLGWSLGDLAQRSEINPNTISRYESGRDVLASKLRRLEEALKAAGATFTDEPGHYGVNVPKIP